MQQGWLRTFLWFGPMPFSRKQNIKTFWAMNSAASSTGGHRVHHGSNQLCGPLIQTWQEHTHTGVICWMECSLLKSCMNFLALQNENAIKPLVWLNRISWGSFRCLETAGRTSHSWKTIWVGSALMDSLTVWACYLKKEGATLHLHNWHIFPSGLWQRAGPWHNGYARGGRGDSWGHRSVADSKGLGPW